VGPFRVEPALPVTAVKTYAIASPLATHWRAATCEEAECPHHLFGWVTAVDERTDLGQAQAHYIRKDSGRGFTEERGPDGLTRFTFTPGQRCFASGSHRVLLDRPERFLERDGDWRGNPTGRRIEHSVDGWLDSFGEHQERLAEALEKG
jgi:hypothetical protein